MSVKKTAWHPPFTDLLKQKRPRWATVTGEVQLNTEPLRVDDLIELHADSERDPSDTGGTLLGMWPHIERVGLLEYKSVVWPFHHGDLYCLLAYGMIWLADHQKRELRADGSRGERWAPREVTLILTVPSINKALRDELDALGLVLPESRAGYHAVVGALLRLLVVDLGVVSEQEDDDFLRWFAGHPLRTLATQRWVRQHLVDGTTMSLNATPDLEGYDEFVEQYLATLSPERRLKGIPPEQRLAGLPPEQRLAGLPPEQRLAGLSEAEQVLALSDSLLRLLPDDYIATLPPDVQATVRARRGR